MCVFDVSLPDKSSNNSQRGGMVGGVSMGVDPYVCV